MIRSFRNSITSVLLVVCVTILTALCTETLTAQTDNKVSDVAHLGPQVIWVPESNVPLQLANAGEARAMLVNSTRYMHLNYRYHELKYIPESVQVTAKEIRVDAYGKKNELIHLQYSFSDGQRFMAGCSDYYCYLYLTPDGGDLLFTHEQEMSYGFNFGSTAVGKSFPAKLCSKYSNSEAVECVRAAAHFASAANALMRSSTLANFNAESFRKNAAAWRVLAVKPEIPDDVRTQRLLAEDAIKNNRPEEALGHYDEGLGLDPTWAQGWFNAAMIAGQMVLYADAVAYMQNYLELMPDAPDAQAARDQVTIWKYKAKTK